ncbi:nucleoside hydrolase [Microbacterium gorillae]|uniref:nucleoside hydrolase n=1 Tax=Microbacterium gorillae TaxID=1231063 RepID=UPI003D994D5D
MKITDDRTRRVIINSDVANEADDQFAVVHAMLSPTLDVRGVIAAHFGTGRTETSQRESREELELLGRLLGDTVSIPAVDGAPHALVDEVTPVDSPGARLIIEEARRDDAGPLFLAFLGPLTDLASALLLAPDIAQRDVVLIWIGGPPYGDIVSFGSWPEFNLKNDIAAANVVFDSGMEIRQVPANIYRLVSVSYAELRARVEPHGALGEYLTQKVHDFNAAHHRVAIESRSLGDSPAIGMMLEPWSAVLRRQSPVRFAPDGSYAPNPVGGDVFVVESVDTRFLLEDMFAKIAEHAAR